MIQKYLYSKKESPNEEVFTRISLPFKMIYFEWKMIDESLVFLTNKGKILLLNMIEIETILENNQKDLNKENYKKMDKDKFTDLIVREENNFIIDFKFVDSNNAIIIFVRKIPNQNIKNSAFYSQYTSCYYHDITLNNIEKKMFNANGHIDYQMISSDFSGNRIISIKYHKKKNENDLGLNLYINIKYDGKKTFTVKPISFDNIKSHISSICFMYKHELNKVETVIIGEINGNIHLFELKLKKKNEKYSLKHLDTYNELTAPLFKDIKEDDELIYNNDFAIQIIKSKDHKYGIIRTNESKILIMKIENKKMKAVKIFKEMYNFNDMRLTLNGRTLITGGQMPSSFMRIDLSEIDEESFGGNLYLKLMNDCYKYENPDFENNDLQKNLKIWTYKNEKKYNHLLVRNANENKVNKGKVKKREDDLEIEKTKKNINNIDSSSGQESDSGFNFTNETSSSDS